MDDLAKLDATAQAELVRRREVSPLELVEAAIARIERLNPTLNAVITPLFEEARAAARGPLPDGPFTGVPFLLKDLLAECAGTPLSEGSAFLRGRYRSPHDSELVARYRRAGLIILGKTNTSEFGILPTAEPAAFGPARNPWDLGRSTGGSSGGSAAAVAAGLVPAAHANDGGGSIRIPAACCGLFGLKPTRGRNPLGPEYGDLYGGLVCEHVVTRSVRDSAALLDATAGPMPGDPYAAPPLTPGPSPARGRGVAVGRGEGWRLRIAFSTASPTGTAVHPACVAAVKDAAALCADLGHIVEEAAPAFDGRALGRAFAVLWAAGTAWSLARWAQKLGRQPLPADVEPLTWALAERGRGISAVDYLTAVHDGQRLARDVARFFETYDLWLTPVVGEPPPPLGTFASPPEEPTRGLRRAGPFAPFTYIANMTGQPAMSVPLYWTEEGLPIGVHFLGRFGDEATLFRLAAQLEEARPWARRRPPVCA